MRLETLGCTAVIQTPAWKLVNFHLCVDVDAVNGTAPVVHLLTFQYVPCWKHEVGSAEVNYVESIYIHRTPHRVVAISNHNVIRINQVY